MSGCYLRVRAHLVRLGRGLAGRKRRWIAVGVLTGVFMGSGVLYAAVALETPSVSGRLTHFTGKMADDRVCRTTATTLEEIPGTRVEFTQGSGHPEPIEVTFVASWPRPNESEIPAGSQAAGAFVFLFVDGIRVDPISNFGGVLVHDGSAPLSNGTHGFTFVTEPIAPGDHVASIHFLDNVLGVFGVPNGTICVDDRSTVVEHK
jgi:hypothetical protein